MNKKGFVISTTLYGIFGIMLITIATILFVMASNRTTVDAMSGKESKIYFYNLRPVINLKADILLTRKGTIDNPYKIAN